MESIEDFLVDFPTFSVDAKKQLAKLDKEKSMREFDKLPQLLRDFINYNDYYVPVSEVYYEYSRTRNIEETIKIISRKIKNHI